MIGCKNSGFYFSFVKNYEKSFKIIFNLHKSILCIKVIEKLIVIFKWKKLFFIMDFKVFYNFLTSFLINAVIFIAIKIEFKKTQRSYVMNL